MNLSVKIGSLTLKNPVTVASGTAGYGEELSAFYDLSEIGAVITKGLSLKPRPGNSGNRIIETPSGILNSIGLENVGIENFLSHKLPFLEKQNATVIANAAGHSIEENVELCRILSAEKKIHAIELNVSCPNVKEGGIAFGSDIKLMRKLLTEVREVCTLPLIVKLSPNVSDITEFALCAEECGADAVSAINTLVGMKIDIKRKTPHFNNKVAGLSGPAVRPVAVRMVYQIFEKVSIPILGLGGISNVEDALEFILAGARAISIGTMNLVYPARAAEIAEGLSDYMTENGIDDINDLVGYAHSSGISPQ
ncbi:MAG TPA: dihydroorotate dehydrogenase [Spirochaetota bacterium]|nr:dihydroorotate dehydrogenase [Spirochaetota bacterium]